MTNDGLVAQTVAEGDDDAIRAMLDEICRITGMGFAAFARVTEDRWIAAQVLDKIEFGLKPGDELEVKTTICDDIRRTETMVVIDAIDTDGVWHTHPTPTLYGFKSYVSLPVHRRDGTFYGTLCAIDPKPRTISARETIATLQRFAATLSALLPIAPALSTA